VSDRATIDVTVAKDRRGWVVSPTAKQDRLQLGGFLRSELPHDLVLAHRDGYLVLRVAFGKLVELFPPDDAHWAESDAHQAREFSTLQARQRQAREEVADALEAPYAALRDYTRLDVLDSHQIDAVAAMTVPSLVGLALFDEQGTGKTITTLAAFEVLQMRGLVDKMLVIAPKSVSSAWTTDAKRLWEGSKRVVVVSGSREERRRSLRQDHDVLVVGYESAVSDKVYLRALLERERDRYLLVADESFYVKNPSARRSAAVAELRAFCDRAFVLCGTPAPNSARDVVHQIDLADAGTTFARLSLPRTAAQLDADIRGALEGSAIILRRLKEDVLDYCPPKEIERTYIEFQPKQGELYKSALTSLVSDVLSVDEEGFRRNLTSYMARRSALLQICSHPGALLETYDETPAKLIALDKLVYELVMEQSEKVIVWSFYRFTLGRLDERLRKYGLVRIDGSVADAAERAAAIDAFQHDPTVRIFLGNPAAAGAGITLTAAAHAIYESFSNQPAHYLQSIDRIHRRGQIRKVTTHVLVTLGSLEEPEFDRLLDKEKAARDLFRDSTPESVSKVRFLTGLGVDPETITSDG
jgi:SNF2 family DNA or RNA helicase